MLGKRIQRSNSGERKAGKCETEVSGKSSGVSKCVPTVQTKVQKDDRTLRKRRKRQARMFKSHHKGNEWKLAGLSFVPHLLQRNQPGKNPHNQARQLTKNRNRAMEKVPQLEIARLEVFRR